MGDLDEYIFDDDGNPIVQEVPVNPVYERFRDEEDLKDIFHMKTVGYDVTLSLAKGQLSWSNVSPTSKKKGMFKGKSKAQDNTQTLSFLNVFGVKMKRKKGVNSDEDGICLGFSIHSIDSVGPNVLFEKVCVFEHPSDALCSMYVRKIQSFIDEIQGRPKSVKLFLQGHSGNKIAGALYKNKVAPLFQTAEIHVDCVEVQHNEHIKQEMVHLNLEDYDCIVAMGGDGTVNKVTYGLLTSSQKYRDLEQKSGFTPVKAKLPLGVIPTGITNDISRSISGTDDITTATLCIIMGQFMNVDVCSVYGDDDKLQQWCYNCQYGFAGNVLNLRKRYKSVGKRGLEPAFIKALTKAKLRAYKCDIEYILADKPLPKNKRQTPCHRGCDICWDETVIDDSDVVTQDLVQAFDPLAESNDSDDLVDLAEHENSQWHTLKGDFFNIGLFSLPGRSDMAPRGMSKFTHINDGVMDLVLIREAERKDFIRCLKRLGNAKNQFDFPFIQTFRVKQVKFRMRLPIGFNYNDFNYSEIDYEIERQQKKSDVNRSMEILDLNEDDTDDSDNDIEEISSTPTKNVQSQSKNSPKDKPPMLKANSFTSKSSGKFFKRSNTEPALKVTNEITTLSDCDSDEDSATDDEDDHSQGSKGSNEIVTISANGVRTVRSAAASDQKLLGPQYRMTFAEQDRAKRRKHKIKKEEKKRKKEVERMRSVWNIDNEINENMSLEFRVHHGLLKVSGMGASPDVVIHDSSVLCIPRI